MVWVAIQTSSGQAHTVTVFTSPMFVIPVFVEVPNLSATKLFIQVHYYWMSLWVAVFKNTMNTGFRLLQEHRVQTATPPPHPHTKKQQQ